MPPVAPMLAKVSTSIPDTPGLFFEPKWDGFRAIIFRDNDEIEIGSRNERPMKRYFPELLDPIKEILPAKSVIDGEIVIVTPHGLDFEALLQRIHPADSRVKRLAAEMPASFVAFDLLALGMEDLRNTPFADRRKMLEAALSDAAAPIFVTPSTRDHDTAADWFDRFEGAGLDGVVAKGPDLGYHENERVMIKVKHIRTADCVVAGFRWHKSGPIVGSLLLGLFDDDGILHHVGVCGAFSNVRRKELVEELEPYRAESLDGHPWAAWADAIAADTTQRTPGGQSRWNAKKDVSWQPLRPELVCEVKYDHLQGDRFRHATQFVRWRTDRNPESCKYSQLETANPETVASIFAG